MNVGALPKDASLCAALKKVATLLKDGGIDLAPEVQQYVTYLGSIAPDASANIAEPTPAATSVPPSAPVTASEAPADALPPRKKKDASKPASAIPSTPPRNSTTPPDITPPPGLTKKTPPAKWSGWGSAANGETKRPITSLAKVQEEQRLTSKQNAANGKPAVRHDVELEEGEIYEGN